MRSLRLEFLRLNNLATGIWREGDPYLVAAGSDEPIRQFTSPLEHETFLDLVRALRYQDGGQARQSALREIGEIAANLLGANHLAALADSSFPLQLDLVLNPAEVAALPFEAALDGEGHPLFARTEREIVLTRRARHGFAERQLVWPARPRVLYAWASPPGAGEVPAEAHEAALRRALEPWLPPEGMDSGQDVLSVIGEATLARLAEACRTTFEQGAPFTHVHLLAHGYPVGPAHKPHFGMALHADDGDLHAVAPDDLVEALRPLADRAVVATLATCDSANLTNTIVSRRSIAHALHEAGFPVVVASQFPLTVPGSNLVAETLYRALLSGEDARIALHRSRVALHDARQTTGHDWASLVGYMRLPEGYAQHRLAVRLEAVQASLRTMRTWSERLVGQGTSDPAPLERAIAQLQDRIAGLQGFLRESEQFGGRGVFEENLGLLGSAEKSLAELYSARGRLGDGANRKQRAGEALRRALDWYRQAYRCNLSHHWSGVQQLSLEASLDGHIADTRLWHAAIAAAEFDAAGGNTKDAIWALGSLAEAYLLAPLAGQGPQIPSAHDAIARMKARSRAHSDPDAFPLDGAPAAPLHRLVDQRQRLLPGHDGSRRRGTRTAEGARRRLSARNQASGALERAVVATSQTTGRGRRTP
jgi:hypothetical protein